MDHARRRRLVVAAGVVEAHPQHLGVADQLGDGVLADRVALLALHLGDQLGEPDERAARSRPSPTRPPVRSHRPSDCASREASCTSPARNTRSHGTNTSSNTTKPSGIEWWRAGRIVERVQLRRREAAVDDRDALGVDRDRERHGVVGLVLPHALGRHHHQFVHQRRRGDVQLGAAHDDALVAAARRCARRGPGRPARGRGGLRSPFGSVITSAARRSLSRHVAVHPLDVGGVLRVHLGDLVLDAHQRHEDAGDAADDRHVVHQLDALLEVGLAARDLEDAVRRRSPSSVR